MKYPNTRKEKSEGEKKGRRNRVTELRTTSKPFKWETLTSPEGTTFRINSEILQ